MERESWMNVARDGRLSSLKAPNMNESSLGSRRRNTDRNTLDQQQQQQQQQRQQQQQQDVKTKLFEHLISTMGATRSHRRKTPAKEGKARTSFYRYIMNG